MSAEDWVNMLLCCIKLVQPLTKLTSPEGQILLKDVTDDRCLSATSKKAYAMRLRLVACRSVAYAQHPDL